MLNELKLNNKDPKMPSFLRNKTLMDSTSHIIIDNHNWYFFLKQILFSNKWNLHSNLQTIALNTPSFSHSIKSSSLLLLFNSFINYGSGNILERHPKMQSLKINLLSHHNKLPTSSITTTQFLLFVKNKDDKELSQFLISGQVSIQACNWWSKDGSIIGRLVSNLDLNMTDIIKGRQVWIIILVENCESKDILTEVDDFKAISLNCDSLELDTAIRNASYFTEVCILPEHIIGGEFQCKTSQALEDSLKVVHLWRYKNNRIQFDLILSIGRKNSKTLSKQKYSRLIPPKSKYSIPLFQNVSPPSHKFR